MTALASKDSLLVEIGGMPISLRIEDEAFRELVSHHYQGFLGADPAKFELQVQLLLDKTMTAEEVRVQRKGACWLLERGDFCALWDPSSGRGQVEQHPFTYSLDSVLRIVHSLILADQGGFLLHAASAVCDGGAYLFSGVSGAGKTTLSRLAPADVTLLTDEISYVRPGRDGYLAYGTPFAGELAKSGKNCAAPIRGLFFLEKGVENRTDEVAPSESVGCLMRNVLFFAQDRGLVETLFATACEFVSQVPVRRLTFYPDSRVWDTIREFEGEPAHV
jgi:hypothetical protein